MTLSNWFDTAISFVHDSHKAFVSKIAIPQRSTATPKSSRIRAARHREKSSFFPMGMRQKDPKWRLSFLMSLETYPSRCFNHGIPWHMLPVPLVLEGNQNEIIHVAFVGSLS